MIEGKNQLRPFAYSFTHSYRFELFQSKFYEATRDEGNTWLKLILKLVEIGYSMKY